MIHFIHYWDIVNFSCCVAWADVASLTDSCRLNLSRVQRRCWFYPQQCTPPHIIPQHMIITTTYTVFMFPLPWVLDIISSSPNQYLLQKNIFTHSLGCQLLETAIITDYGNRIVHCKISGYSYMKLYEYSTIVVKWQHFLNTVSSAPFPQSYTDIGGDGVDKLLMKLNFWCFDGRKEGKILFYNLLLL